jgi:nitroimidazol reductase NimA-like FMN-containing flavoprotein (pyridoxamine 5'-phosphate oxidase superfamily)
MDMITRDTINEFLAAYNTLVIATESEGQPFATSTFYAEKPLHDTEDACLTLYATFITSSRKLANLRQNPQVGLFIGPQQPANWLEAIAHAHIIEDEQKSETIRQRLREKSAVAAAFLAQVPTAAVELHIQWLRITNLTAAPLYTEVTFPAGHSEEE